MKLIKFLIPAVVLSLMFTSCAQKDYSCVCADDFCPMPWVQAEIKGKTKKQAKAECDTHNFTSPESGITRTCELQ